MKRFLSCTEGLGFRRIVPLTLVALIGCSDTPALEHYDLGGDVELTDHRGDAFSLSTAQPRVRLLFFGFTSCPDVCPTTMSRLQVVMQELEDEPVEVLLVSVDPKHDTPSRLTTYLERWQMPATGLTGQAEQIREIARRYGAAFQTGDDGQVDHSARIYLLDRDNQIRYLFSQEEETETMVDVIHQLL